MAIRYYKHASSINNNFAKNNLGVIYKSGANKNIPNAISYFTEAIKQKNDELAMYNLARLVYYENGNFEKAVLLLLMSLNMFPPSFDLLCILLIKKLGFITLEKIRDELKNYGDDHDELARNLYSNIKYKTFEHHLIFEYLFQLYSELDFYYDSFQNYRSVKEKRNSYEVEPKNIQNINDLFYEGFGFRID